jgi:hypothetical protein
MSSENKFFDEATETLSIGPRGVTVRLNHPVDLETELHLTNTGNQVGGNFLVVWINRKSGETGLAPLEAEGDLWGLTFAPGGEEGEFVAPPDWLECPRCHQRRFTPIPEAEEQFVNEGFTVARHCERCKATTPWNYSHPPHEDVMPATEAKKEFKENRQNGRVPLVMPIKLIREKYGKVIEEECETVNVSRTGVCFRTAHTYEQGEAVQIIMPFKDGEVAIPVPARVVRTAQTADSYIRTVAIKMERRRK